MSLIEVEHLARTFVLRRRARGVARERSEVRAVDDVSFSVEAGEMVGYIGPNGAGKSTTIKMLTGILVPTSGRVEVAGLDPSRRRTELARRIGVVFGQRSTLWWDLPLRDSFELLQKIYRIPPDRYRRNLAEFVDLLELGSPARHPGAPADAWVSGCAATSRPRCCTTPRSSTSTNPRSGSTS